MMTAVRIRHEAVYAADPDTVYAMLVDPAYRVRVCEAMGVLSQEVSVEPAGEGHLVRIDQEQPTAGVPSFARKFAGETTRAVQVETWQAASPRRAALTIETPGKPTRTEGSLTLGPHADGAVVTLEADLTVTVPLIGGRLEKLMADLFRAGRETEHAVGVAWLEGDRG